MKAIIAGLAPLWYGSNTLAMLRKYLTGLSSSRVWLTPDLTLGFHQYDYAEGQYEGFAHTHPEYAVVMSLAGEIEVAYDNRLEIVRSGELLIVNPGEIHHCRFGRESPQSRGFTLIVRSSVVNSMVEAMGLPGFASSHGVRFIGKFQNPEAFDMANRLIREFEEQRRGYRAMIEIMVRQILLYLFRDWPADAIAPLAIRPSTQLSWLHMHRATEYMNAHGKGQFRLTDLCDHVGLSASRFIPLFKNSSGINPLSYYNSLIIFKARRLLYVEHLSTKEAAYALGFKNVSHFCTLFQQITGATAGEIKN